MTLITQRPALREEFDLLAALPRRAAQGERFLKQRTLLQVKIVPTVKNEEKKSPQWTAFSAPSVV